MCACKTNSNLQSPYGHYVLLSNKFAIARRNNGGWEEISISQKKNSTTQLINSKVILFVSKNLLFESSYKPDSAMNSGNKYNEKCTLHHSCLRNIGSRTLWPLRVWVFFFLEPTEYDAEYTENTTTNFSPILLIVQSLFLRCSSYTD